MRGESRIDFPVAMSLGVVCFASDANKYLHARIAAMLADLHIRMSHADSIVLVWYRVAEDELKWQDRERAVPSGRECCAVFVLLLPTEIAGRLFVSVDTTE